MELDEDLLDDKEVDEIIEHEDIEIVDEEEPVLKAVEVTGENVKEPDS